MTSVGIVGAGLIGASWASLFSAYGCKTIVFDPDPDAGRALLPFAQDAWESLVTLNPTLSPDAALLTFTHDLSDLGGVDFVQENAPDRLDIKQALIADLESILRPDTVIASSTSSLLASDIQSKARFPGRILVGHPMNPPHLVPMVELVAGRQTGPEAIDAAERLFRRLDRVTVRVRKEVVGHLANRLAEGYTAETGRPWTQLIGFKHALFEVVADVIARAEDLEDPAAIVSAIAGTNLDTIVGPVNWANGPINNVTKTPLVGGQWQKEGDGLALKIVANSAAPEIPTTSELRLIG